MALLNHEHIIKRMFDEFTVTDFNKDLCDDYHIYSLILGGSYKVYVTFEPKSVTFFVFMYEPYKDDMTIDSIFQMTETEKKEYNESVNLLYSSGTFIDDYLDEINAACKELSLETQVLSGSLFDKYVKQKG